MEWVQNGVRITTVLSEMDVDAIVRMLQSSYWAGDRARSVIEKSLPTSVCFGAFNEAGQIGFARVVTDRATFAWLCDVIVEPAHRSKGIGKLLVQCAIEHPDLSGLRIMLGTRDAHELYSRYGFERREMMMRRPREG